MKNALKYTIAWVICLGLRLIPFRPANAEPLLGTLMPLSKLGLMGPLAFTVSSVILYDALTAGIGPWTWLVALTYGVVSLAATSYFSNKVASRVHYVTFAVISTILFDAATGLTMGPYLFQQSFMNALLGQIPFTMAHLAGNVLMAAFVTPLIAKWLVDNPALELQPAVKPLEA